jgi:peroxiredoxin
MSTPSTLKSLAEELTEQTQALAEKIPAEIRSKLAEATEQLKATRIEAQALNQGAQAPRFTLPNAQGRLVALNDLLAKGPVVLSFYRGGWCPYCSLELRSLQQHLPAIQAAGASLVAVSPEQPDQSLSTQQKNELTFEVLSDLNNVVAKQFGLVFQLPEEVQGIYQNLGIDLNQANGPDSQQELPVPATYIIQPDGNISFAFVNADYQERLEPAELISALKR